MESNRCWVARKGQLKAAQRRVIIRLALRDYKTLDDYLKTVKQTIKQTDEQTDSCEPDRFRGSAAFKGARCWRRRSLERHSRTLEIMLIALAIVWGRSSVPAVEARPSAIVEATAPDLQITHVRAATSPERASFSDIQIRWTAQVPKLTIIESFDVLLEVHYGDGSRSTSRSDQLKSSSRSMIFQIPSHPRQSSSGSLKDYKAVIRARFRVSSTLTVTQEVTSSEEEGSREVTGSSSSTQPQVFITGAKLSRCVQDRQCVELRWAASAPRSVAIHRFTAAIEAVNNDGTRSVDSKTVSGAAREVRLRAGPADSRLASISVRLLTNFSAFDSKTVIKEGLFSES